MEYSVVENIIKRENPNLRPQKILAGSPRILNFDPSRVWVDVNVKSICVLVPNVG